MKKLILYLLSIASFQVFGQVNWPLNLDSNKPIHKIIINSILVKPNGGKFKGQFFLIKDNSELRNNLKFLLDNSHRIQFLPVEPSEHLKTYSVWATYKVLIDNEDTGTQFRLYAAPNDDQRAQVQTSTSGHRQVNNPLLQDATHVILGFGAINTISKQKMAEYIVSNQNSPVLIEAFKVIEGSDLANANDRAILTEFIVSHADIITEEDVINLIDHDIAIVTRIKQVSSTVNTKTMFRDQLKSLLQFGTLKAAKRLLHGNRNLLNGTAPRSLEKADGGELLILKTALFYIALAKAKAEHIEFGEVVKNLTSFYPGRIPANQTIQRLIEETNLFYDGLFYSPANSYVKNADTVLKFKQFFSNLPVRGLTNTNFEDLYMHFGDCSGFVCHVLRKLRPDNIWVKNNRFMSWHLAVAYDSMMHEQRRDNKLYFYDVDGNRRLLTDDEKKHYRKWQNTPLLNALKDTFEPVYMPKNNIKAGDIVVTRDPQGHIEGHVVIVVDYDANTDIATIIELTRAEVGGTRHGYTWRKMSLTHPGPGSKVSRVLRIKLP